MQYRMSGIDLGVKLRELGHYGAIVYLSISPEYAVESYAARAFYYLMKPVEPAKLYQVLDQAAAALENDLLAVFAALADDERVVAVEQLTIRPEEGGPTHHAAIVQRAEARIITCF